MKQESSTAGKHNKDSFSYESFEGRKPAQTNRFLWWCAGAHQKLLKQFPAEQIKYSGLGGVVLATFALASLSSGYAFYTVFGNLLWSSLFALLWGAIIFNLDRFLVSTMRKYRVSRRKQLLMALPRFSLALLIGLTIARPLELKIFEKEIAVKMEENLHQKVLRNDSLLHLQSRGTIDAATAERSRLQSRKAAIEDTLARLQTAYLQEADGTGGSGQRGIERLTLLKQEAFLRAKEGYAPELRFIDSSLQAQQGLISSSGESLEERRKQFESMARSNLGFLERNKALSDLAAEEASVWWALLMVSLLIILVETGPIISKLILPVGPYDVALAREELLQMAADEDAIQTARGVTYERRKVFHRRQQEMTDELTEKLTAMQQKQIDEELKKWERGQWDETDHRPSMDEVLRKIKSKYLFREENGL
ncbi:MAG TPA: DUF4407 domain-containing protein [Flavisolibacter sp.]|nr:DUF4407 domain-containing protein [Flavisolibacter sp.]